MKITARGKRKAGKIDQFLVVLIVALAVSLTVSGCTGGGEGGTPTQPPSAPPSTATEPQPTQSGGDMSPPTQSPTQTPTPTLPCKNWLSEEFVITHYATVLESDEFFPSDAENQRKNVLPFYDPISGQHDYKQVPKYAFYVGNQCEGNCGNWRVSVQGSGKLTEPLSLSLSGGKQYVQADTVHLPPTDPGNGWQPTAVYYFTDEVKGACGTPLEENASIAVAGNLLGSSGHQCGDRYFIDIPGYENKVFTIKDSGTFTVQGGARDHFDIYVGAQTYKDYYNNPEFTKYDGKTFRIASVQS